MPDEIRIGIIGVGQVGKMHLDNYRKIPAAKVIALADIDRDKAKYVAQVYNIPAFYQDYEDLLSRADLDAVDVCLHNNLHMPVTVAALKAGKDVYCEKPMASSYHEAKIMLDTAKATGRRLSIQLSTLFLEETHIAKALIMGGFLGHVYHARSTGFRRRGRPYVDGYGTASFVRKANAGGGAVYDAGVYNIARILYLLGNPEIATVSGQTHQEIPMDPDRKKRGGYDVEELGVGFVRFENGVSMDLIEAWAIHLGGFEGSFIVGSSGGLRLEPFGYYTNLGDYEMDCTIDVTAAARRRHLLQENADAYDSAQAHWVAALQGRVELLPTAEIALNSMLVSDGIYLSTSLKREVTAQEIKDHVEPRRV